jgi:hypothetical protein
VSKNLACSVCVMLKRLLLIAVCMFSPSHGKLISFPLPRAGSLQLYELVTYVAWSTPCFASGWLKLGTLGFLTFHVWALKHLVLTASIVVTVHWGNTITHSWRKGLNSLSLATTRIASLQPHNVQIHPLFPCVVMVFTAI